MSCRKCENFCITVEFCHLFPAGDVPCEDYAFPKFRMSLVEVINNVLFRDTACNFEGPDWNLVSDLCEGLQECMCTFLAFSSACVENSVAAFREWPEVAEFVWVDGVRDAESLNAPFMPKDFDVFWELCTDCVDVMDQPATEYALDEPAQEVFCSPAAGSCGAAVALEVDFSFPVEEPEECGMYD